jgi:hypothetical protein
MDNYWIDSMAGTTLVSSIAFALEASNNMKLTLNSFVRFNLIYMIRNLIVNYLSVLFKGEGMVK